VCASMGLCASRLLAPGSEGCSSHPCIPSRAFPARPQADRTVGASGFCPPRTQPVSLEIGEPPCSFPPRWFARGLSACRATISVTARSDSLPAFRQVFPGRSVIQALILFPEGNRISSESSVAEAASLPGPCDSIDERTFLVSSILLNIPDRSPLVQASALMLRRPGGLNESDRASVK
jgi:hypothetical protein